MSLVLQVDEGGPPLRFKYFIWVQCIVPSCPGEVIREEGPEEVGGELEVDGRGGGGGGQAVEPLVEVDGEWVAVSKTMLCRCGEPCSVAVSNFAISNLLYLVGLACLVVCW